MSKDDSKNPRGHPPYAPLAPQLAQLRRRAEQKAQALNSLEIATAAARTRDAEDALHRESNAPNRGA